MNPEWHLQKTPEEWQHILQMALSNLRKEPHNTDHLDAIADANKALNAYEHPKIVAGEHTLTNKDPMMNGWGDPIEGIKGELQGMGDAVAAPFHLANVAYRQGIPAALDEIVAGIKAIPGQITGGDAREIGHVAGGTAGTIAMGRLGSNVVKGLGSAGSALVEMPKLKTDLLKAQIHDTGMSTMLKDIAAEQSGTKGDILGKRAQLMDTQLGDAPMKSEILGKRSAAIDASLEHTSAATKALQDMIENRAKAAPFQQSILEAKDYMTRNKAYAPTWPEPEPVVEDPGPPPANGPVEPARPQNANARALKAALDKLRNGQNGD
jgi:hypothetical protein